MKAALLPDRGVVKVAGDDARNFLHGLVSADILKLAPGAARFCALLTPQGKIIADFFVARGAGRGWRRLLPRPPAHTRQIGGRQAQPLQAARSRDRRRFVRGPWRAGGMGWTRRDQHRPLLCRPAPAGTWAARHAAAASRRRGGRRSLARSLVERRRVRSASHRARHPARRHRFRLRRRLPARGRHGSAGRRRFRQGLLCRPGSGFAHGAPRHRAHPRLAGSLRRRRTRRRRRRHGRRAPGRHHGLERRPAAGLRSCASIGLRKRCRAANCSLPAAFRSGLSNRIGRALPSPTAPRPPNDWSCALLPNLSRAAPGRRTTRSISPITTRNGACRNSTTARSTRSLCSTASRPACRGSRSCASARISAAPSTASCRRKSRATRRKKSSA